MDARKIRIALIIILFFLLGMVLAEVGYITKTKKEKVTTSNTEQKINPTNSPKIIARSLFGEQSKKNIYGKETTEKGYSRILGVVLGIEGNKIQVQYSESGKDNETLFTDENTRIVNRSWFMNPAKGDKFIETKIEEIKKGDQVEIIAEKEEKTGIFLIKTLQIYK